MKPEIKEFLKKYIGEEMEFSDYEDFKEIYTGILTGYKDGLCWPWIVSGYEDYKYCRPKQAPKYIPYTLETVPDCLTGRYKGDKGYFHINVQYDGTGFWIVGKNGVAQWTFTQAFEELEHFDGSPFGTEVK